VLVNLSLLRPSCTAERLVQVGLSLLNGTVNFPEGADRTALLLFIGILPPNLHAQRDKYDLSLFHVTNADFAALPAEYQAAWQELLSRHNVTKTGLLTHTAASSQSDSLVASLYECLRAARFFPREARRFLERLLTLRGKISQLKSSDVDKLLEGTS